MAATITAPAQKRPIQQLTVQKIQDWSSFQPTKKRSSLSNRYACKHEQSVYDPTNNKKPSQHTTIDKLAACTTTDVRTSKLRTPHPFSRSRFPPERITRYATMLIPSSTTAKDIRNPTDRHIEQKYRSSPWQSSRWGKLSQVSVREEHRRWRP